MSQRKALGPSTTNPQAGEVGTAHLIPLYHFTPESIRARRAEDEAGAETGHSKEENLEAAQGGGWQGDSGMEETGGPGQTALTPCSHIPRVLPVLTDPHPAFFPVSLCSGHPHSTSPPGNVNESIS